MASVLFIIRVPYKKSSESLETEQGIKQTVQETEDKVTNDKSDDKNVKEVKENENEANIISGDTNEAEQIADDVETLTDLNLAEV